MSTKHDLPTPADSPDVVRRRLARRLFLGLPLLGVAVAARPSVAEAGSNSSTCSTLT